MMLATEFEIVFEIVLIELAIMLGILLEAYVGNRAVKALKGRLHHGRMDFKGISESL
jgi:hypothetical protein